VSSQGTSVSPKKKKKKNKAPVKLWAVRASEKL
jgi:hypothetical protein